MTAILTEEQRRLISRRTKAALAVRKASATMCNLAAAAMRG